jgi:hypothetical protein
MKPVVHPARFIATHLRGVRELGMLLGEMGV